MCVETVRSLTIPYDNDIIVKKEGRGRKALLQQIAQTFVTTFDNIFVSIFGVTPLSFDGMNIMIAFTAICGAVLVYCQYRLRQIHRNRKN